MRLTAAHQEAMILGAHPYPAAPGILSFGACISINILIHQSVTSLLLQNLFHKGIPLNNQNVAIPRQPSQAGIQQVLKALPPSKAQ